MNFNEMREQKVKEIEEIIYAYLPKQEGLQERVIEAMRYSVMAGGKRIRPMLMQEAYRMYGGTGKKVEAFMAALEYIHTYSLVHDDLPAMDNDEYRRGRKTTHIVYGEDIAILAGDALLNYAYEIAADALLRYPEDNTISKALCILTKKAGIYGMVGGQCVDVISEKEEKPFCAETQLFVHEKKTACLIECALMCGAALAGADSSDIALMEKVGSNVGIAFQIQDDILDETSTFEELGKPIGSDAKNNKYTYLSFASMEEAVSKVQRLTDEAMNLLEHLEVRNAFLEELIMSLISRRS